MSNIIGLNAFHADASACLLIDGELKAAAEEERFLRVKHWAGFPKQSINYCLSQEELSLNDIDVIAVNTDPSANFLQKISFSLSNLKNYEFLYNRYLSRKSKLDISESIEEAFGEAFSGKIHYVEHHKAHLLSAHTASPFESSLSLSVDALGDFVSTSWGLSEGTDVSMDGKIYFPHSLGVFYEAMTHYLGFKHFGDEYKVMGLAPYGKPTYVDKIRKLIIHKSDGTFELNLEYFSHQSGSGMHSWEDGIPSSGDCYNPEAMQELLGPERQKHEELVQHHMDVAHSIQQVYEETFFMLANSLHEKYKIDFLTLSGGCGNNSVANGKIYRRTPFRKAYVAAASGDAGGAIGAAIHAANDMGEINKSFEMSHAYLGPEFSNSYHKRLLDERNNEIVEHNCKIIYVEDFVELARMTSDAILEGNVIGWFQGKMEWGPRALGNRSIICDPRRTDMKDILNLKIKRRESFRPFAPSILEENVGEWFEETDDVPFMMKVFQIKAEKRKLLPAVTHVDGSGRLQTVSSQTNPRYHELIKTFYDQTGVPILLNTSFNENEPVVCKPEEALNCFLRTKMDVLVLGNHFIKRLAS
ncbi:MAG: carbamoyltransferase [Flavobacteriales bacterium]|nr:carbamoyltransferase [Flavobacteriales bacterium]